MTCCMEAYEILLNFNKMSSSSQGLKYNKSILRLFKYLELNVHIILSNTIE